MQGDDVEKVSLGYYENVEETKKGIALEKLVECVNMSSWCKIGVYDIDFGWGKPIWAANFFPRDSDPNTPLLLNTVMLMDTKCGTGIEVWMSIDEQYVAEFDKNEELHILTGVL
ncbi:hypothetical protein RD792_003521 [Penstemon davidsonii]|uniref:Uncharacterized protein n=1 Tax=Penstemon davidsonii TaxID=160366 RepID=A0ABR0DV33_9LAMI|nr:hypothetical protein RD792_003521 [Penstemon davidsonii]